MERKESLMYADQSRQMVLFPVKRAKRLMHADQSRQMALFPPALATRKIEGHRHNQWAASGQERGIDQEGCLAPSREWQYQT